MSVPTKVLELVERFDRNLETYKQGKYNENPSKHIGVEAEGDKDDETK